MKISRYHPQPDGIQHALQRGLSAVWCKYLLHWTIKSWVPVRALLFEYLQCPCTNKGCFWLFFFNVSGLIVYLAELKELSHRLHMLKDILLKCLKTNLYWVLQGEEQNQLMELPAGCPQWIYYVLFFQTIVEWGTVVCQGQENEILFQTSGRSWQSLKKKLKRPGKV